MNSDFKDNGFRKFLRSFGFAFSGIFYTLSHERNMKIHLVAAALVSILGWIFHLSSMEWMFVLFAIFGMFSLELVNTAIERTVDLVTEDFQLLAKQAKDIAAGAVLVYALLSVIIGCIIFLPKFF
jgi:undecaprenol kinase